MAVPTVASLHLETWGRGLLSYYSESWVASMEDVLVPVDRSDGSEDCYQELRYKASLLGS